jgi:uncharacterized surface protein with fasciclin (FAS1) repeats
MKLNTLRRTGGIAAVAVTMSLGLAACSGDETSSTASDDTSSSSSMESESPMETPAESDAAMANAGAETFGPGCSAVPASGAGSFDGMVQDPVATAASNNPLLSTLVTAVGEAGLVDTLNDAEGLTVFAPTNDAFAEIPEADLNAVLADKKLLTKILTHHVIAGKLGPDQLAGNLETLAGDKLKVKGSGESFKVGAEKASILCGNVPTANATVYIIDSVLMPA